MERGQPEEKMDKTMQHGKKLGDYGEWWPMGFFQKPTWLSDLKAGVSNLLFKLTGLLK